MASLRPPPEPEFDPLLAVMAWLAALVFGITGASLMITAAGYRGVDSDQWPLWLVAFTFVPLWVSQLVTLGVISRQKGSGRFRRDFSFEVRAVDVPIGLLVGVVTQLVFVWLLYQVIDQFVDVSSLDEPAKQITDKASGLGIALLVVLVAVGAPFVEELFFRGFVLRAFNSRINDTVALVLSAGLFALAHFQLLQFPGLFLFGLVTGYLMQRFGRLGPSIFAHMGFNAVTVLALIAKRH